MSLVVLAGLRPPARVDDAPWTNARIELSEDLVEWAELLVVELDPVDEDPARPAPRSFQAEAPEGAYLRVVWEDEAETVSLPTTPIRNADRGASAVRPTALALAGLMRARIVDGRGQDWFTEFQPHDPDDPENNTNPSAEQAEDTLDSATDLFLLRYESIPPRLVGGARALILLKAAQLVEMTYYADQLNTDQSAFDQWTALYEEHSEEFASAMKHNQPGRDPRFGSLRVVTSSDG